MTTGIIDAVRGKSATGVLPAAVLPSDAVVRGLAPEDEVLLHRLLSEPADYVDHPAFQSEEIEESLYDGSARLIEGAPRFHEYAEALPEGYFTGERMPSLSHEREQRLFMRYNFARRQVVSLLTEHAGKRLSAAATRRLIAWGRRAMVTRSLIVRLNLPLVLAMAKRTRLSGIDFNEMISEGNMALLRSVEKFDCSRGFKFSTYSCRAILKSFSRVAMRASRYRGTFPAEFDPAMERSDYVDRHRDGVERDCVDELKDILLANLAGLSDVERVVIQERFAIGTVADANGLTSPKTLEQVGTVIGVTKERVRQIQNNALRKMRAALEERYLAA